MGYIWQRTRNVIIENLVHAAMRSTKHKALRGQVLVMCKDKYYRTAKGAATKHTTKPLTCLRCIGSWS